MPLTGNVEKNIKELESANKSKPKDKKRRLNQIIAIAINASKSPKK